MDIPCLALLVENSAGHVHDSGVLFAVTRALVDRHTHAVVAEELAVRALATGDTPLLAVRVGDLQWAGQC